MRITALAYRETKTFGNYQNVTIEAQADLLSREDDPVESLGRLRDWVQVQLANRIKHHGQLEREEHECSEANYRLAEVNRQIDDAKAHWQRIQKFMAEYRIPPPEDIPF